MKNKNKKQIIKNEKQIKKQYILRKNQKNKFKYIIIYYIFKNQNQKHIIKLNTNNIV